MKHLPQRQVLFLRTGAFQIQFIAQFHWWNLSNKSSKTT